MGRLLVRCSSQTRRLHVPDPLPGGMPINQVPRPELRLLALVNHVRRSSLRPRCDRAGFRFRPGPAFPLGHMICIGCRASSVNLGQRRPGQHGHSAAFPGCYNLPCPSAPTALPIRALAEIWSSSKEHFRDWRRSTSWPETTCHHPTQGAVSQW